MDRSAALTNLKARRTGQPSDDGSQPAVASTSGGQTAAPATKAITALAWLCDDCGRECAPIRTESRCMCGHRLREHDKPTAHGGGKCCVGKCGCRGFFYIVAEGSWILKCRCKHKHVVRREVFYSPSCAALSLARQGTQRCQRCGCPALALPSVAPLPFPPLARPAADRSSVNHRLV